MPLLRSSMVVAFCLLLLSLALGARGQTPAASDIDAIKKELAAIRAQQAAMQRDITAIKNLLMSQAGGGKLGPQAPSSINIAGRPSKGSEQASLIMVEFTDFQCPYCGSYVSTIFPSIERDYINSGKIRYIVKNLPLQQIHPNAYQAAVAAMCAADEGRFWQMHDRLFANQRQLGADQLEKYADQAGVDRRKFKSCVAGHAHDAIIREDMDEATQSRIGGTPAFMLATANADGTTVTPGRIIIGAQPYSTFKSAIDALLAK